MILYLAVQYVLRIKFLSSGRVCTSAGVLESWTTGVVYSYFAKFGENTSQISKTNHNVPRQTTVVTERVKDGKSFFSSLRSSFKTFNSC